MLKWTMVSGNGQLLNTYMLLQRIDRQYAREGAPYIALLCDVWMRQVARTKPGF